MSKTVVVGTFEWMALQKKPIHSNFFGKCKRFIGESKFEKKPAPNSYKFKTKWTDATNILKTSASATNLNLRSVYYS